MEQCYTSTFKCYKQRAFDNVMTRFIEKDIRDRFINGDFSDAKYCLESLEYLQQKYKYGDKTYYLVTINPLNDNLDRLMEFSDKLARSKVFKICHYSVEQRSEEKNVYIGYHIHMFVNSVYNKIQLIQKIYRSSTAKRYSELGITKESVDVRPCDKKAYDYILGEKSEDKQMKVKNDRRMRRKYGLQDLYQVGTFDFESEGGGNGLVTPPVSLDEECDPNIDLE